MSAAYSRTLIAQFLMARLLWLARTIIMVPTGHFMNTVPTPSGGGGGGGTLKFLYIRRLGLFFGVQNFEFQNFLLVFKKINIYLGMKILWIFLGSPQNWPIFMGHFFAF